MDGTNTLAVEIHQASTDSNDLSFDLQLVAREASSSTITAAAMQPDQQFQLRLCGPMNSSLTIESSLNLSNWTFLGSLTLSNGAGVFTDPQATNLTHRFYRAAQ